jgi:hypothetical protein
MSIGMYSTKMAVKKRKKPAPRIPKAAFHSVAVIVSDRERSVAW